MDDIITFLRTQKKTKEKTVKKSKKEQTTIRIPEDLHFFIKDLTEYRNKYSSSSYSKQKLVEDLIKYGIDFVKKELEKEEDFEELKSYKYYVLNDHYNLLYNEKIVIETNQPVREKEIPYDLIYRGDWVFLYKNGKGIVEYSKYLGEKEKKSKQFDTFKKIKNPLPADKINEIIGEKLHFLGRITGLPNGEKVLEYCESKISDNKSY